MIQKWVGRWISLFVDANVFGKTIQKSKEISIIKTDCDCCKEKRRGHDGLLGSSLYSLNIENRESDI